MAGDASLADRIDALLPQTQCTRCGYDACRPYAEAVADGSAAINRCPPGGDSVIRQLSTLTGQPVLALDPVCGEASAPLVALIDEESCIGCAKCLPACPTDAIIGARKRMHTVISADCTGCELCLPPCPVDCISMVPAADWPAEVLTAAALGQRAELFRQRYERHLSRLARG